MTQERMDQMIQLMEHDKDIQRARAYLALEIGHEKARCRANEKEKPLSS